MLHKRQIVAFCLAAALAVGLTACKGKEAPAEDTSSVVTADTGSSVSGAVSEDESSSANTSDPSSQTAVSNGNSGKPASSKAPSNASGSKPVQKPQVNNSSQTAPKVVAGWDTLVQVEKKHQKINDQEINGSLKVEISTSGTTVSQTTEMSMVTFLVNGVRHEANTMKLNNMTQMMYFNGTHLAAGLSYGDEPAQWQKITLEEAIEQGLISNDETGVLGALLPNAGLDGGTTVAEWKTVFDSCTRTEENGGYRLDIQLSKKMFNSLMKDAVSQDNVKIDLKKNAVTMHLTKDMILTSISFQLSCNIEADGQTGTAAIGYQFAVSVPHKTQVKMPDILKQTV